MRWYHVVGISAAVSVTAVLIGEALGSRGYLEFLWPEGAAARRRGASPPVDPDAAEGLSESENLEEID